MDFATISTAEIDAQLVASLENSEDGAVTKAAAVGTGVLRSKIREEGFARKILPFKDISKDDLDQLPDSELPACIEEMEPDSPGAVVLNYNDAPDNQPFYGRKYVVLFHIISTPEMSKNVNELLTYQNNVRQIVTDNLLRDIQVTEDTEWIATSDSVVGNSPVNFSDVALSTTDQNVVMDGAKIDRENYNRTTSFLEDRMIHNGVFLFNRRTQKTVASFDRNEAGGDIAEKTLTEGAAALEGKNLFGVKHISTYKRKLVENNVVYQYAKKNFLGRAYRLQDIMLRVERKNHIIRFRADEHIGVAVGNTRSIQRVEFDTDR